MKSTYVVQNLKFAVDTLLITSTSHIPTFLLKPSATTTLSILVPFMTSSAFLILPGKALVSVSLVLITSALVYTSTISPSISSLLLLPILQIYTRLVSILNLPSITNSPMIMITANTSYDKELSNLLIKTYTNKTTYSG